MDPIHEINAAQEQLLKFRDLVHSLVQTATYLADGDPTGSKTLLDTS